MATNILNCGVPNSLTVLHPPPPHPPTCLKQLAPIFRNCAIHNLKMTYLSTHFLGIQNVVHFVKNLIIQQMCLVLMSCLICFLWSRCKCLKTKLTWTFRDRYTLSAPVKQNCFLNTNYFDVENPAVVLA